jgi:fructose-bisphosphate aldolase class 1
VFLSGSVDAEEKEENVPVVEPEVVVEDAEEKEKVGALNEMTGSGLFDCCITWCLVEEK